VISVFVQYLRFEKSCGSQWIEILVRVMVSVMSMKIYEAYESGSAKQSSSSLHHQLTQLQLRKREQLAASRDNHVARVEGSLYDTKNSLWSANALLVPERRPTTGMSCSKCTPTSNVLADETVKEAVKQTAEDMAAELNITDPKGLQLLLSNNSRRAEKILTRMHSKLSNFVIRMVAWVLHKTLPLLLKCMAVPQHQIQMLKEASTKGLPMIYLPLHRRVLQGLGAFFIKRRIDPVSGKKDKIYRALLHTYMTHCIEAGHHFEFFIEGGRTRTGKPCMPKDCSRSTAVMSTNALAFLLLHVHRDGATLGDLTFSLDVLRTELSCSDKDVGFCGESKDVLEYAIELLGPGLIQKERTPEGDWFIKPVTILPNVIELSYYSNAVLPHFAIESVLALTAMSLTAHPATDAEPRIDVDSLIEGCVDLCDILQYEFIFTKTCQNLNDAIYDTIDHFSTLQILVRQDVSVTSESPL
ncbi:unnamed protein product, partial [Nesidiocoris tenuis]